MNLLQIDVLFSAMKFTFLVVVVLPIVVFLCVKFGTAAFYITKGQFEKKVDENESER